MPVKSEKSTSSAAISKTSKKNSLSNNTQLHDGKIKKNVGEIKEEMQLYLPEANAKTERQDKWEPQNWRLILENIRLMRSSVDAPVDTMGCHKCSDDEADEKVSIFEIISNILFKMQSIILTDTTLSKACGSYAIKSNKR